MKDILSSIDVLCNSASQLRIFKDAVEYADQLRNVHPQLQGVELRYWLTWQGGSIKAIRATHPNGFKHKVVIAQYNERLDSYFRYRAERNAH